MPCGEDEATDHILTNPRFLKRLIDIRIEDPGVILQLSEPPRAGEVVLESVFPAFKFALAEFTSWPGILVWSPCGDAAFFELTKDPGILLERSEWLFYHLATQDGYPDLQLLKQQFDHELQKEPAGEPVIHILHMSDLHLGSSLARRRSARVQTIIETVISEIRRIRPCYAGYNW